MSFLLYFSVLSGARQTDAVLYRFIIDLTSHAKGRDTT